MMDYKVSRLFTIPLKIKRHTPIHDVAWAPPSSGVIKFNCDGSSVGTHPCAFMLAMDKAQELHLYHICLETESGYCLSHEDKMA